ncbi:patched domain-containing protein 3-like [Sardina pilchardus]|uniref:patched domain-containing protein 3-like n=1 Tax=Sardina pilchardus TaxID=27697 RepID=UPI002E136623
MSYCKTDCIERPISRGFAHLGRFVGRYPWWFLIPPLIISAGLGAGFYFLEDRESNNIDQFTLKNGPAKTEKAYIKEHFPQGEEFSSLRLYTDGTYASLIAVHPTNILTKEIFQEVVKLDQKVKQIQSEGSQKIFTDLCAKDRDLKCVSNPILDIISVSFFTSISGEEELDKISEKHILFFMGTYFVAIIVFIMFSLRLDCVRNKVWVATFGVLSAGLAVLSSFGLLLFCGMPFVMTVATAPFLILGIGMNDVFGMISCWQKTNVKDEVEDRMAETYKEAAVSSTITTLTDAFAFYIGLLIPFQSVQSFCMYTSTAILFCYIYNITFFGAFLALNGRREGSNRHWLTCRKVTPADEHKSNACSVGGAYDPETKKEEEMPMDIFFKKLYGPFLTKPWTKVCVILLYLGYLAAGIYGCFQIQVGTDLKNLAPDDSYVAHHYDNEDRYFSEYGPFVMLVIRDENFRYWNRCARESLNMCLNEFESSDMVAKNMTIFWLEEYEQYGRGAGLDLLDENVFIRYCSTFLNVSGLYQDVNISSGKIVSSRLFIPTVNITTATDEKNMLNFFRDTASTCGLNMDLMVYHPAFISYDQYAVITTDYMYDAVTSLLTTLLIHLLSIPHPCAALWATFANISVTVGVTGLMVLWDVHLDSISMISVAISFSVNFSADISYAFVSSGKKTANGKVIDALYSGGYPIVQGVVSTIAGVVVLSAAESYIFRTYFKIMFLVILFSALHGIVFTPIFLTFFGCCSNKQTQKSSNNQNQNFPDYSAVFVCPNCNHNVQMVLN